MTKTKNLVEITWWFPRRIGGDKKSETITVESFAQAVARLDPFQGVRS